MNKEEYLKEKRDRNIEIVKLAERIADAFSFSASLLCSKAARERHNFHSSRWMETCLEDARGSVAVEVSELGMLISSEKRRRALMKPNSEITIHELLLKKRNQIARSVLGWCGWSPHRFQRHVCLLPAESREQIGTWIDDAFMYQPDVFYLAEKAGAGLEFFKRFRVFPYRISYKEDIGNWRIHRLRYLKRINSTPFHVMNIKKATGFIFTNIHSGKAVLKRCMEGTLAVHAAKLDRDLSSESLRLIESEGEYDAR
jgi:hypothetical protein